jgi:hypothetical protein
MLDNPEDSPSDAIIAAIRDMLDDPIGREFVVAAVTAYSFWLVGVKKGAALNERQRGILTFARMILDDVRFPPGGQP